MLATESEGPLLGYPAFEALQESGNNGSEDCGHRLRFIGSIEVLVSSACGRHQQRQKLQLQLSNSKTNCALLKLCRDRISAPASSLVGGMHSTWLCLR